MIKVRINDVDFDSEEVYGLGAEYDIKGKESHDISPNKIKQLVLDEGDSAFCIYMVNC